MCACIPEVWGGYFEEVRPPSTPTAHLHDPPPPIRESSAVNANRGKSAWG